ncbi:MAG: amidohydrolase family protein [Candidatus Binataceae bacterium]
MAQATKSAKIHAKLPHPVIDSDGHWVEYGPAADHYLEKELGSTGPQRYWHAVREYIGGPALNFDHEKRRKEGLSVLGWWAVPTKYTADRAAVMLPKLLHERIGDLGLDFAVMYPTAPSLTISPFIADDELRPAGIRAFNTYTWDLFRDYRDRFAPVAVISTHTPREAIDQLQHAGNLGFKAVVMGGIEQRPSPMGGIRMEAIGLDDDAYDPVFAKCVELKIVPTFHTSTLNFGYRSSTTNFTYNHVGHFAAGCEALCKAIFMGGITRRFPQLKIAFLEGGAAWACNLYNDLIRHWKIRNPKALENVDPARLDRELMLSFIDKYGNPLMRQKGTREMLDASLEIGRWHPQQLDDFWRCKIERAEDIKDLFVNNFYFGCEAEDPMNGTAYNTRANAFGAQLKILMGSDIGHFDVFDITEVLEEAYELVEHGVFNEDQFREFTFSNAARFWTSLDRDFFKGTAVETEVNQELAGD